MGRAERLYRLADLLREPKRLRFEEILERLGVSPATLKRDLKYLRERLGTPVTYDSFDRAYYLADASKRGRVELPGLWVGAAELMVLALAYRLVSEIDPQGRLAPTLKDAIAKLENLVHRDAPERELSNRVKLLMPGKREVDADCFAIVSEAVAQRRRLRLHYLTRSRNERGIREVSPQRLVFLRTWYLDAWCHHKEALRRFSLDAIQQVEQVDEAAMEIPLTEVEHKMDGAYGAFAGQPNHWAVLEFQPSVVPWVEREVWHPMQRSRRLSDGGLELMLPYQDAAELVMDILRYGDAVRVRGDAPLRAAVADKALATARIYGQAPPA